MDELFKAINDWPVIVQGALGSALFAACLYLGQIGARSAFESARHISKKSRLLQLREQLVRYRALAATDKAEKAFYTSILWLRASRHVVKALILVVLGFIFDSFVPILGLVAYIGALVYLFKGLEIVKPILCDGDVQEKLKQVLAEYSALKKEIDSRSKEIE